MPAWLRSSVVVESRRSAVESMSRSKWLNATSVCVRPFPLPPPNSPLISTSCCGVPSTACTLASTSKPSKLLRVRKFTTPATASEPYKAVAPSLSSSTRSNAIIGGSADVSTKFSPRSVAAALCVWRRPFTSTSVELTPRPRRFTLLVPVVWFCVNASGLFCEPVLIVRLPITSLILFAPLAAMSSADMMMTGDGASACVGRLM
jgi:hypothetical protein